MLPLKTFLNSLGLSLLVVTWDNNRICSSELQGLNELIHVVFSEQHFVINKRQLLYIILNIKQNILFCFNASDWKSENKNHITYEIFAFILNVDSIIA